MIACFDNISAHALDRELEVPIDGPDACLLTLSISSKLPIGNPSRGVVGVKQDGETLGPDFISGAFSDRPIWQDI